MRLKQRQQQRQEVTVRFEPCEGWTVGPDLSSGACLECGWLEEDHWLAELDRGDRQTGQPVTV